MKYRISAILLLTTFLSMLQAHAQADWQSDIERFDAHRWNSETMINASIMSGTEPLSDYTLAAYIEGELRGYVDTPTALPNGGVLYSLRVRGDEADSGKSIALAVIDTANDMVYTGDDISVSIALTWTGETFGLPSAPVIVRIADHDIAVESITVTDGVEIYRGDYDKYTPLLLNDYFTVLPEDATDKSVTIVLADDCAPQGSVAYNKYMDRWEFTPSDHSKGKVDFIITSNSNPEVTATLTITVRVRVESMNILKPIVNMSVGETLDISNYYEILPKDADNRQALVESLTPDIVSIATAEDGTVTMTALAVGYGEVKVSSVEAPQFIYDFIAVNVGATLSGLSIDIYPCDDDIIDSETGEITIFRQPIFTPRSLAITPYPDGANFDPALLGYEISLDTAIPTSWSETSDAGFKDGDIYSALFSFTPAVPGIYTLTITYDDDITTDSAGKELVFNFQVVLKDNLVAGWNWISTPVADDGTLLSDALANPEYLIEARTQNHFLINDPEIGFYTGFKDGDGNYINDYTLDRTIDHGHFRVKMSDAVEQYPLIFSGKYNFEDASWALNDGWTWVENPVPYDFDISMLNNPIYAFADGDVIKSDSRLSTFVDGAWVGMLTCIEAGRGYSVMSSKARKLNFNCSDFAQNKPAIQRRTPSRFVENMAVIAVVDGCEAESVDVFVGDEKRGSGQFIAGRWFIAAQGDPSEIFTIRITDALGEEITVDEALPFSQLAGSYNEPLKLSICDDDIHVDGATVFGATAIFDLQGRDVTASNGTLCPGVYIATCNNIAKKVTVK